jgi:hypothetical protein
MRKTNLRFTMEHMKSMEAAEAASGQPLDVPMCFMVEN